MNDDLVALAKYLPIFAAIAGLWFRLEVGMRGNRMKITELEKRFEEDRKSNHEDIREMKTDLKNIMTNQATIIERDKSTNELLKKLLDRELR